MNGASETLQVAHVGIAETCPVDSSCYGGPTFTCRPCNGDQWFKLSYCFANSGRGCNFNSSLPPCAHVLAAVTDIAELQICHRGCVRNLPALMNCGFISDDAVTVETKGLARSPVSGENDPILKTSVNSLLIFNTFTWAILTPRMSS